MDRIPETRTAVAARYLATLTHGVHGPRTPVAALPVDEEELSDEAVRAIEEGIADHEAGRTHNSEEVKRELGI